MRILHLALVAMAMMAPAYTQTTPPAAPSLTAGAEFKGLRFDWDTVAGASWYQFEYRAHQTGPFVQQGSNLPASATSKPSACHCTCSTGPMRAIGWRPATAPAARAREVSVSSLRRFAVGYFKPALTLVGHGLWRRYRSFVRRPELCQRSTGGGHNTGGTRGRRDLRVPAPVRRHLVPARAAVPTIPPFIESTNILNVAISGDGNTVALGMPQYFHEEFDERSGEVFVFRFDGTSWVRTRTAAQLRAARLADGWH